LQLHELLFTIIDVTVHKFRKFLLTISKVITQCSHLHKLLVTITNVANYNYRRYQF